MEKKQARNRAEVKENEVYTRYVREDGKVQIPKGIRKAYYLKKGDAVVWERDFKENEVIVRFMSRTLISKEQI